MSKLLLLLALSTTVFANDQYDMIKSVELVEIVENADGELFEKTIEKKNVSASYAEYYYEDFKSMTDPKAQSIGEILATAETLVGLGESIYTLVQKGKPAVNLDAAPISVLPMNLDKTPMSVLSLTSWKEPIVKRYRIKTKNYFGATTVDFRWKVIFSYGGQADEKGAFITGAIVKPEYVNVLYGYDLSVNYKLQSISNIGTTEDPIAQAIIDLDFKIESVLQTVIRSQSYLISGQGKIKTL